MDALLAVHTTVPADMAGAAPRESTLGAAVLQRRDLSRSETDPAGSAMPSVHQSPQLTRGRGAPVHDGLLELVRRCSPGSAAYQLQLDAGVARARDILGPAVQLLAPTQWHVIPSTPTRFRLRSKFGWDAVAGTLTVGPGTGTAAVPAGDFPPGSPRMVAVMAALCPVLRDPRRIRIHLCRGLTQVLIHTAHGTDSACVTLVYSRGTLHRQPPRPSGQSAKADRLRAARFRADAAKAGAVAAAVDRTTESDWCGEAAPVAAELGISITAVAKGVLWTVGPREIEERLELADGAVLRYRQVPGSFSNPNGGVNVRVLQWLRQQCFAVLSQRGGGGAGSGTLLEMYNGCGNHTVALASLFGKVIAVEGDRALVDVARRNYALNGETPPLCLRSRQQASASRYCCGALRKCAYVQEQVHSSELNMCTHPTRFPGITNVEQVGSTCEAFAETWTDQFAADLVIVDPPRTGLSQQALSIVRSSAHAIILSCNQVFVA